MVTSKTDICNLSQDLLCGETLLDIDSPTTAVEALLQRWYDHCRKQCLREHPWKFAAKRASLAKSATDPLFGYTAAFPLPSDFLRMLTIENDDGVQISTRDYQIESHNGQYAVLMSTDATVLNIRYVYDIEDVTRFDALFISYLAYTIALATAFKITQNNSTIERVKALQDMHGKLARSISGQERPPTRIEKSVNKQARKGGTNRITHRITFDG